MRANIIIASLNEGNRLWKLMVSCLKDMSTLNGEIIAADNGSEDGSLDKLRHRFPQMSVSVQPACSGCSPTKNLVAQSSRGDMLVFLDGPCKPESGAIPRLVDDIEQLVGHAIIMPRIPTLNAETWQNNPYQGGHAYRIDLDRFRSAIIGLKRLRLHASATNSLFYESPALIGCCFAISRWLYQLLWGLDTYIRMYGVEDINFGLKS